MNNIDGRHTSVATVFGLTILLACLAACDSPTMIDLPSENQGSRIDYVVLHFTSEDYAESVRLLTTRTENPVSAHYLIPLAGDPTYPRRSAIIHRLVPEERRAWHAGRSYWAGEESLNSRSIGIEIVNLSRCETPADETVYTPVEDNCRFKAFTDDQIELVIGLLTDILARYPGIDAVDVIGHADIAPARRYDPGPLFPWQRLYEAGIGAWPDETSVARWRNEFSAVMPTTLYVQEALAAYGYKLSLTGEEDLETRNALRAFQLHFLPSRVSGLVDQETAAVLFALLEKYRPDELEVLAQSVNAYPL